jgi:hypothetical protein
LAEGKTAFAAAELAGLLQHLRLAIPGTVDHDGAAFRRAVFRFQPDQPARTVAAIIPWKNGSGSKRLTTSS